MIDVIIPKKQRKQSMNIITYISIYTHLNNALNLLGNNGYKRAFDRLTVAKSIVKQIDDDKEKPYLKKILKTIDSMMKIKEDLLKEIKKETINNEQQDPYHIRTSIMLAQNICVLRILKINKN
tara:strand:+ start:106 stop:474 length:369 start_codon:yes stop_codon:yes gene_type:complete